jgi:hypothetical protein
LPTASVAESIRTRTVVGHGVGVTVAVRVAVAVGVTVGVDVTVTVAVALGVAVSVGVEVLVAVAVGVPVLVAVAVAVSVTAGPARLPSSPTVERRATAGMANATTAMTRPAASRSTRPIVRIQLNGRPA